MKSTYLLVIFILFATNLFADNVIPSELVGTWHASIPEGNEHLYLRPDGLAAIFSSIGCAGIASYNSKQLIITISLRDEHVEKAKAILIYNPKTSTIIFDKLLCYYDMHGPTGRLSEPKEEKINITFGNHEKNLPDSFRAADIKLLQENK